MCIAYFTGPVWRPMCYCTRIHCAILVTVLQCTRLLLNSSLCFVSSLATASLPGICFNHSDSLTSASMPSAMLLHPKVCQCTVSYTDLLLKDGQAVKDGQPGSPIETSIGFPYSFV